MKGRRLWIAWKSLRQHALSTWIASGSIALAGGLLMAVWALRSQAESTFTEANGGFDAVLGPAVRNFNWFLIPYFILKHRLERFL